MTLAEIREECWALACDLKEEDRLWSKQEMDRYINRVYRKIASETRCIRDSLTPACCIIQSTPKDYTTYVQGTLDYLWANDPQSWLYQKNVAPYLFDLHKSILQIDDVKLVKKGWRLHKVSSASWEDNPYWERVIGPPTQYATDLSVGKLAVNFRDTEEDYLQLKVRRLPLEPLVGDKSVPEFRDNYHDAFFNGVLALMFSRQDSEGFDAAKSNKYANAFIQDLDDIKKKEIQLDERLRPNGSLAAFR
jgi:hypothetical protein